MRQGPDLNIYFICSLFLQGNYCKYNGTIPPDFNWTIDVDEKKCKTPPPCKKCHHVENRLIDILQVTDIHVDPKYQVGRINDCIEPTCCRTDQAFGNTTATRAGAWGAYECDTPYDFVDASLEFIREHFPCVVIMCIMLTGMHDASLTEVMEIMKKLSNRFHEYCPHLTVLSTFGNHDEEPFNSFDDSINRNGSLTETQQLYHLASEIIISQIDVQTRCKCEENFTERRLLFIHDK